MDEEVEAGRPLLKQQRRRSLHDIKSFGAFDTRNPYAVPWISEENIRRRLGVSSAYLDEAKRDFRRWGELYEAARAEEEKKAREEEQGWWQATETEGELRRMEFGLALARQHEEEKLTREREKRELEEERQRIEKLAAEEKLRREMEEMERAEAERLAQIEETRRTAMQEVFASVFDAPHQSPRPMDQSERVRLPPPQRMSLVAPTPLGSVFDQSITMPSPQKPIMGGTIRKPTGVTTTLITPMTRASMPAMPTFPRLNCPPIGSVVQNPFEPPSPIMPDHGRSRPMNMIDGTNAPERRAPVE